MAKGFNKGPQMGQGGMMQQLQRMQKQMEEAQAKLAEETVTATAGGGAIKVIMTGDQKCQSVEISPDLLMDADADGHHIATLLLTFFYRHMKALIDNGHVFLAQPPLYRIDIGKQTFWALDDIHKERLLREHGKSNSKPNITRFKGLGEMNPETLKQTTLDPKSRQTLRVTVKDTELLSTDRVISELMGKDVAARFKMITENAAEIGDLDV
jgi:DNA-binding YbaB/EbfC family protein